MAPRSERRKEFLHAVFVTALEGGIDYWAIINTYHIWQNPGAHWSELNPDLDGFESKVGPNEDFWGAFDGDYDPEDLTINIDVIATGVSRFKQWMGGERGRNGGKLVGTDKAYVPENEYWKQFLISERTNGDDGDYDASVADVVVQLGLFDQVVYG